MKLRFLSLAVSICLAPWAGHGTASAQDPAAPVATPQPAPRHEANFDAERKQANELFLADKKLEALPLYEDLCRQDPTIAVFAERHGVGLILEAGTFADQKQARAVHDRAIAEFRRAQSLGDNSPLVQQVLDVSGKNAVGAVLSGVPLTIGYTYGGNPPAQEPMKQGNMAFARNEWAAAAGFFKSAATIDPAWYTAALYTGDAFFRAKDTANAVLWFEKAVAIDPNRETGYRYWADALVQEGDDPAAKVKYELALVAEPFAKTPLLALQGWARRTHARVFLPHIVRPGFTTPDGKLQPDPSGLTVTGDGHEEWLIYQKTRVAHGAPTLNQLIVAGATDKDGIIHPSGYRHSLAEEDASITVMLADVQARVKAGTLVSDDLELSIKLLLQLQKQGFLDCWIFLDGADAGIRADYPAYRATHRDLLLAYVDHYLVVTAPASVSAATSFSLRPVAPVPRSWLPLRQG